MIFKSVPLSRMDRLTTPPNPEALLYIVNDNKDFAIKFDFLSTIMLKKIKIETSGLAKGGINDSTGTGTINVPKADDEQASGGANDEVALTPFSGNKLIESKRPKATKKQVELGEDDTAYITSLLLQEKLVNDETNIPRLDHETFKVIGDSSKFTMVTFPLSLGANDRIQIWREGTDSIGGTDPNWNDGDATYFGEMSLDIDASGTRNCLVNAYQSRLIIGGINTKHTTPKQAEVFLRASPNGATYHYRYLTRAVNPDVAIMTSAVLPSAHRPYDNTGAVSVNVYGSFHEGMDRVYSPKNKPTPDAIGALTEAEANRLYLKKAVETTLSSRLLTNDFLSVDLSLYDEVRFYGQHNTNPSGDPSVISIKTVLTQDFLDFSERGAVYALIGNYAVNQGINDILCWVSYSSKTNQFRFQLSSPANRQAGIFKVVGIKR